MKFMFFLFVVILSATGLAAPNCKYALNQENYADNSSGELTVNAIKYKCSDLKIGEDFVTVCKNKKTQSGYDFIITLDGAEADFSVYAGINDGIRKSLCDGQATVK